MSTGTPDLFRAIRGGRAALTVLGLIVFLVVVGRAATGLYIEVLWQSQSGYLDVFWTRIAWEMGARVLAGLLVAVLVFFNLRIAATTLGGIQIRRRFGNLEISEQIPRRLVTLALLSAALLLGLWFGGSVGSTVGRNALLAASAGSWGIVDPVLGRDASFYVFWYPVLSATVAFGLITAFLIFTLVTAGYAATGALGWVNGRLQAHQIARLHLGGILSFFFVLLAVQLWLGRFDLILGGTSSVQGIFGFTDAEARLPALQTLSIISLGAAIATAWGSWKDRTGPVVGAFAGVVLGTLVIGNLYPSVIQSFRVEPNELVRETPYIEHSLDFTRLGFGIADIQRDTFAFDPDGAIDWELAAEQFSGLPVWGSGPSAPILTTFNEVEARFRYYQFDRVEVDRYQTPEGVRPVAISVRQVDGGGLPDDNWQNRHLRERYVAGMGAAASIATSRTREGRPEMLIRGLPPELSPAGARIAGLGLERPEIFYGTRIQADYAVVTPGPTQYLAPDSSTGVPGVDFPEGIRLSSPVRTAMLAWEFGSANLLFSTELTNDSRFIHRRRIVDRALAIAPFMRFPELPYPVVHDGKIVWILEGFVETRRFPLSAEYNLGGGRRVNYVRNSVKITVDAVTGDIDFYRVPQDDPLADAYAAAYPSLFKPMSEMPSSLREHLRYPRTLLDLQAGVLRLYHQKDVATFHGQQDVWLESEELARGTEAIAYVPEYGIYRLPDEDEARFQLTTVFVPAGRENLTAMMVGRTNDAGMPELRLMEVPVADQVRGPRQIEVLVEQDPIISQQFSLWRTGGSEVWTGHLHVVPVGNRLLYMEPVFLAAEADAIPDLTRFVVSDGLRVVMTESLTEAIAQMSGGAGALPSGAGGTGEAQTAAGDPATGGTDAGGAWPAAALTLLQVAEDRARAGDWQGYGEALDELRALLQRLQAEGGAPGR